jgi:hypothetical protein
MLSLCVSQTEFGMVKSNSDRLVRKPISATDRKDLNDHLNDWSVV